MAQWPDLVTFTCNVCGSQNKVESFATEPASCSCGSNVRVRALISLLSRELFGHTLLLTDFPRIKAIKGLGMTDKEGYAAILAEKFDYTNTYYDREPRMDFTESHPAMWEQFDFILSSDVLEHVAPPIEVTFKEVHALLKPCGFFVATVPCNLENEMIEHFPELYKYTIARVGDSLVLLNRRRDGGLEVHENLVFHDGSGATLEMRMFGITGLQAGLRKAGFQDVCFHSDDVPEIGIYFDHDVSQPLVARKSPFALSSTAQHQLVEQWQILKQCANDQYRTAELLRERIRLASRSRWFRLGRRLGIGPHLSDD